MLYGTPQAGFNGPPNQGKNLSSVEVGEILTLLDGTETFGEVTTSIDFARGVNGTDDNGCSFFASGGTLGDTVGIEASAVDEDDKYTEVGSMSLDANGNGAYTDVGRAAFYRVRPGLVDAPVEGITVIVKR